MAERTIAIFLVLALHVASGGNEEPYVTYANEATSERNLPVCRDPRTACNVIYKRHWLSPKVVRHCKCPDRSECPWDWTVGKHTVHLNSRCQLKFCSQVADLNECGINKAALEIQTTREKRGSPIIKQKMGVFCYCPSFHYFQLLTFNSTTDQNATMIRNQYYKCNQMEECQSEGFCGYVTTRRYDTYRVCLCPADHICIMTDRKTRYISEALYEGYAHRATCVPYRPPQ